MAKLIKRLQDLRDPYILMMYNDGVTAQDIGQMFSMSLGGVWEIIKRETLKVEEENKKDKLYEKSKS